MTPTERLHLVKKQLSVAVKALKGIRDNGISWTVADAALDEIERIKFVQEGSTK